MFKYTMIDEKMEFTERMKAVKANIHTRLRKRGQREGTHLEIISSDHRDPFTDVFEANPDAPYVINLAKSIVKSWVDMPCVIYPHEAIVGITRPVTPVMEHFSWGIVFEDWVYREKEYTQEDKARVDALRKKMTPMSHGYMDNCGRERWGELYNKVCNEDMFWAGGYQGHTIPNYVTLLENGLDGMLQKIDFWAKLNAKDQDTADFYEANRIIVRGMSEHMQKYADHAAALYETEEDPVQKQYYKQIAENCAHIAHKKPQTLYQAVQLTWCLSLWDWVDCLGRMDQYFLPFYNYSCEHGDVIPVEESVTSMIFKIWEGGAHNVTLSGCKTHDGSDATNDITFLILQVLRNIHDTHPRICVRIREDVNPELMNLIVKIWSEGMSDPSIISDTLVIPGLQRINVPIQDARDFATLGCQEIEIPGKSNTGCEDGSFNVAKVFEIAMRGGKATTDPDYQLGPVTKSFLECETFEEFYDSFAKQLEFFTEMHTWLCSRGQECRAANHAKLVKGVFTDGVLETGRNHDDGGPVYGYGVIETAGIAAVADSMTAIKKLVFDEKKITKEKLVEMLAADFNGYEKERQLLLNGAPKFGNDDPDADEMAVRVLNTYWDEIAKYKSVRGGVYTGACSLLEGGISYGHSTGALPDGRHKGEPLGNTMGPRPGADHNGVTAMLSSVSKLPLYKGVGGTTLNVILTTKMTSTPEQRDNIAAIVKNYMASGGQMAQITTANVEDLIDAKVHPERHGDLIVRVGGYSIQFVQLGSNTQDEIISRYAAG
ncbi:MAG: hypothetical protein E7312_02310 [Clostridiales bacterium]|nr:hypothetical protein [Clostridiales bacterium]